MVEKEINLLKRELQRANEDLEDLQKYIEALMTFLPLPFCVVNPLDFILDINQAFQELASYGRIEVVGRNIDLLFLEKAEVNSLTKRVGEENKKITTELTLLAKDKKRIPVRVSASARKDEEGNFIGYFLAIFEISELKRFQEELQQQVNKKTEELQGRIKELEEINRITVGRELKMIGLKEEIKELKAKLESK